MTIAIVVMLCIGIACGTILAAASKIFYVYEDPRIAKVEYFMAGANCGGCGFAGCSAAAESIVSGKTPPNICVMCDNESIAKIAEIMGVNPGTAEIKKSNNQCQGGDRAKNRFIYHGIKSCAALSILYGGNKYCSIGCLGFGDCIKSCNFNAISISNDKIVIINEEKCVGCKACEIACPKNLIQVKSMSEKLLTFNDKDSALAPCRQTCPAEINIPAYIKSIKEGDYKKAVEIIRERNPLLSSCGRVCPHPCEDYCRRGIEDDPVSINQLKRFVADYEMNNQKRYKIQCAHDTNKKIAVIGGGPAGLSTAYFLKRLGHNVTIFESMPKLGGIIRYGIPEYRLPKKTLDWEIQGILDMGIKHYCNKTLGVDFTIKELRENEYDAIFIGIGAWSDYDLGIKGENLVGCWKGISFLSTIASNKKVNIGKKAIVVGGGNSAIDCVRTLKRLGCNDVTILYRRTKAEMPANKVEIKAAEEEGVNFKFLAAPTRILGNNNDQITHLEYLTMELGEPDSSGRRRPVPIKGSETKMDIDMLITAIGQRPIVDFIKNEENNQSEKLKTTKWNTLDNNPYTLQTSIPYIFTAGDCATGPSLVVDAIRGGRLAARSIHKYLSGSEIMPEKKMLGGAHIAETIFEVVPNITKKVRISMPELPINDRIKNMDEVDQVITEENAIYESERCLECCRLCYNSEAKNIE